MAIKRKTVEATVNTNVWTVENELRLMKAALKFKPAGIMKHFNMALIHNELVKSGVRDISTSDIWEHLGQFYNLDEANKVETRFVICT